MSKYRHITIATFVPSSYSNGLQPLLPYNVYETGKEQGFEYGDLLDYIPAGKAFKAVTGYGEEEKPPSLLAQYWWVFLVAAPFVYVGVNMALDSAKPQQEKK